MDSNLPNQSSLQDTYDINDLPMAVVIDRIDSKTGEAIPLGIPVNENIENIVSRLSISF